jgi:hypothetical protein
MRFRDFAAGCLCSALVLAPPVRGQEVRIEGRVIAEDTESPIGHARVTVQRPDFRFIMQVEADSTGRFEATFKGHEAVRLRAERIGYAAATTPLLNFDGRNYFQVELRLDTDAVLLAPLEVVVWSEVDPSPLLDNFRRRLDTGQGIYITRAQIDARRPMFMSDMLRAVPGLTLEGEGTGSRPRLLSSRQNCPSQIFVDGLLMSRPGADVRLDDLVTPTSVEGIEIYRGMATIPPEFLNPQARCGVVAVWTRRGGRNPGGN